MLAQILTFLAAFMNIAGRVARNIVITIALLILAILAVTLGFITALVQIVH